MKKFSLNFSLKHLWLREHQNPGIKFHPPPVHVPKITRCKSCTLRALNHVPIVLFFFCKACKPYTNLPCKPYANIIILQDCGPYNSIQTNSNLGKLCSLAVFRYKPYNNLASFANFESLMHLASHMNLTSLLNLASHMNLTSLLNLANLLNFHNCCCCLFFFVFFFFFWGGGCKMQRV